jgi:flagellin
MAVFINTNLASLNVQRRMAATGTALAASLQRLSSGLRINSARDDAAGLAIVSRMTSRLGSLDAALRNANDAISMLQTADGAVSSIASTLQRMRVLAVQAANGSNTTSDREAIDKELQQLSAGIAHIARSTSFNGVNLLDGSFRGVGLQVGAEASDRVQIGAIRSMDPPQLGSSGATFDASGTGVAVVGALGNGDMTLNGISVGPAQAGPAIGQEAASAYANAAAINAVSKTSGVTAKANPTTVKGAAASSFAAIAANTFSINGVAVGAVNGDGTAAGQGSALAAAIQAIVGQTGVAAAADATGAVTLTAADGRSIQVGMLVTTADAATATADRSQFLTQTGLPSAAVGSEGIAAVAGVKDISFSGAVGLGSVGTSITINGVAFTIANAAGGATVVDAHHVTLNINIGGGGGTPAAAATALANAIAVAQGDPQTAGPLSVFTVSNPGAGTVRLSDNTAGPSSIAIASNVPVASPSTFVTGVAAVPPTSATTLGTITLSSSDKNGITVAGSNPDVAGFSVQHIAAVAISTVVGINTLDLLSSGGAENAIDSIDAALEQVVAERVKLGAYQNRFIADIAGLQNDTINLSAARGRIQDADFAAETASLTRARILQQAGMVMLVHVNSGASLVLRLLKGL